MIQVRKAKERGHADRGWLDSYHTFSFADYYDPQFMGFRVLRVINDDRIAASQGFPTHPHRDMEIITYVVEGALEHRDTLGTHSVIRPGEVQRMSAGTGIRHSEFNPLNDQITRLLQIWLLPKVAGIRPSYGQKSFLSELAQQPLVLVASPDQARGSLQIHQDVNLYVGKWAKADSLDFNFQELRYGWLQVVRGSLKCEAFDLEAGDGAALSDERNMHLSSEGSVEFLFFDLP